MIAKPNAKAHCLYKRRHTLFLNGFKLHKMTGADVLTVVQSRTERHFFTTGKLREQYLSTFGKSSVDNHETKPSDLVGETQTNWIHRLSPIKTHPAQVRLVRGLID